MGVPAHRRAAADCRRHRLPDESDCDFFAAGNRRRNAMITQIFLCASTMLTISQSQPPRKILFIGNSLTYSQEGIYTHLEKMTTAATPSVTIQADKAVVGGQY